MPGRNLTVRLDEQVIRRARVLAAQRGTSISQLVAAKILEAVEEDEAYERARSAELAAMQTGYAMGGRITWARDDLHER